MNRLISPPVLAGLACVALLAGCATNSDFEVAKKLIAEGHKEEGVLQMEKAVRDQPGDTEARKQYYLQRDDLVNRQLSAASAARTAGRLDEAEQLYQQIFRVDVGNVRARDGLTAVAQARRHRDMLNEAEQLLKKSDTVAAENLLRRVLTEDPTQQEARSALNRIRDEDAAKRASVLSIKGPFKKPISLEFRDTPLKAAFEVMSRSAGMNFVLDKDVKSDAKITLFIRNSTIDEALNLILSTNQLARKLLNDNSVLIYPNNVAKAKEYQDTVVKSFYLANTDVKQAQALVKTVIKSKDIFIDEKLNLLVVRDTPDAIRLAENLLEMLDLALPEVMLEVDVLEVTRNRLLDLGMQLPDHIGYGALTPTTTQSSSNGTLLTTSTVFGGALAPGNIDLRNRSGLTTFVANPAVTLNIKQENGDSKLLANPRIRVINREKAKIHIGDKLPVFTTTSTANVGVSASVSYLDVGLKLEVEPTVHLDENVEMKVALEVSSIVKEVTGPSNSLAYQVGTRSANTVLRLRDGETEILAGLINDEERSSASGIPGLTGMPVLGRLFSNQSDTKNKTEIVLLITPHVLRNVVPPSVSSPAAAGGTEMAVGVPPLLIRDGALRGISSSSGMRASESMLMPPEPAEAPAQPLAPVAPAPQAPPPAAASTGQPGDSASGIPSVPVPMGTSPQSIQ